MNESKQNEIHTKPDTSNKINSAKKLTSNKDKTIRNK